MGFMADWKAHWRYMGQECRALGHIIATHPLRSLKSIVASPLSVALYWFLITTYFNSVLSVVAERQGSRFNPILDDEGFNSLGGFIDFFDLPNYMLYALLAFTAFRFLPIWPCVKPAIARMVLRRWLFLEGVIFFFRGFSVAMTSVPQPNPECVSTATGNVWIEGFNYTFGITHTCGDCMFSGHTAAVTLAVLFWTHYSRGEELSIFTGTCRGVITSNVDAAGDPMGWKLLDLVLWAYAIVSYYFIIATRFHYSNDVWMGFLLSYFIFKAYHFYIKSLGMRQGSLFSRFMRWFEGINLAEMNLLREQDVEKGVVRHHWGATQGVVLGQGPQLTGATGAPAAGASHPDAITQHAFAAAHDATKDNAILGSTPPATLLPVSYIEGQQYYRANNPNAAALYHGQDGKPPGSYDHKLEAADRRDSKSALNDADVRLTQPAGAGGYEQSTEMAPVRVHGAPVPAPLHNYNPPTGVPILTAGEHASQERREVERAQGAGFHPQ